MARSKLKPLALYRQSTLAGFETCARRTRFALEAGDDVTTGWVEATGDLGTVFHAVAAEMLRTMWRAGHVQMPTEEAINVMREVYIKTGIALPSDARDELTGLVLGFCGFTFNPRRIVALEREIVLDLRCSDGKVRRLKGQPDLIMHVAEDELLIVDWKSGMGKPPRPKDPAKVFETSEGTEAAQGKQYLSERGHFQLDTYGLLAMRGVLEDGMPLMEGIRKATLREIHLRHNEERLATLTWDDLEHVEPQLAAHMQMLDAAISEGPKSSKWKARPGSHCTRQCPVARSCPVPREMRGDGSVSSQAQADKLARVLVVAGAQENQSRRILKAWQEQGNPPGRVNDHEEVRWGSEPDAWTRRGGGRKFGIWPITSNGNGAPDGLV